MTNARIAVAVTAAAGFILAAIMLVWSVAVPDTPHYTTRYVCISYDVTGGCKESSPIWEVQQ